MLTFISYVVFWFFIATFFIYSLIEISPGLLNVVYLDWVKYYAYKKNYAIDDELIFRPLNTDVLKYENFKGGMYSPYYQDMHGIEPSTIPYTAHFDQDGFRSITDVDEASALYLGDSFFEYGESDETTLAAHFEKVSGIATYNAGRSGYGPHQYKVLLERFIRSGKTKLVVMGFFAGNDIEDLAEANAWLKTMPLT